MYIDTEQLAKLLARATGAGEREGQLCAGTACERRTFSCKKDRSSGKPELGALVFIAVRCIVTGKVTGTAYELIQSNPIQSSSMATARWPLILLLVKRILVTRYILFLLG